MSHKTSARSRVQFAKFKLKIVALRRQQALLLLANCAALSLAGLTSTVASGQVEATPHVEYARRMERGMRELDRFSPADRNEVIRRVRAGFDGSDGTTQKRRKGWLDALDKKTWDDADLGTTHSQGRTVFLQVRNENGRISAATRSAPDLWLQEMELEKPVLKLKLFDSADELRQSLGEAATVYHLGDSLPEEWQKPLLLGDLYFRGSSVSPKRTLEEYQLAARVLDRKPKPGGVKILSGLPQSESLFGLFRELPRMGLSQLDAWNWMDVQKEIDLFADDWFGDPQNYKSSRYYLKDLQFRQNIKTATKAEFESDLAHGQDDFLILIAHFDGNLLHFPSGETMSMQEMEAIKRDTAPPRTIVLLSCDTGTVNQPTQSLAEIALKNKLAINVVAPPRPISAKDVPSLLRSYLIQQKSIHEVFVRDKNFHNITDNLPPAGCPASRFLCEKWDSTVPSLWGFC
jgi:hypothetical protein